MTTSANDRNRRAGRAGFTLVELMVVIAIIAIASIIGMGVYMRMAGESEQRAAENYLQTLATALKAYEAEKREFPPMRLGYIDNPNWSSGGGVPNPAKYTDVPNAEESIEAALYCLRYRSGVGSTLESLPSSILVNADDDYVTDGGQRRQLDEILDPWGNPIQYLRPRVVPASQGGPKPEDPLSPQRLNNQVILVSMGPDGMPGSVGINDEDPAMTSTNDIDVWTDTFDTVVSNEKYPDPKELGMGDDIRVVVGSVR